MFYYTRKNIFTFIALLFYIFFIVWRNESSLYQIKTFYQKSHIPDAIFFIKDNKEYFQNIFSYHQVFSNFVFYKKIKNVIDLHYNFNDFNFMQKFTFFFLKEKHLSNIIRDTTSQQIYKDVFNPVQYNSKKTLSDIIQMKPLLQIKRKTDTSSSNTNHFDIHTLFENSKIKSSETIYFQQLDQISNDIANEFDKQSHNTKESFLHFILSNLQKKEYNRHLFGFIFDLDTIKIIMSGYYPINAIESIKLEIISKINTLLYLYKNSQNKMEYLMKQIIMETTFILGLFIDYIYFLFWASSILFICIIHIYQLFFKNTAKTTETQIETQTQTQTQTKRRQKHR